MVVVVVVVVVVVRCFAVAFNASKWRDKSKQKEIRSNNVIKNLKGKTETNIRRTPPYVFLI